VLSVVIWRECALCGSLVSRKVQICLQPRSTKKWKTERRTASDSAVRMRRVVEGVSPHIESCRIVQDMLTMHTPASVLSGVSFSSNTWKQVASDRPRNPHGVARGCISPDGWPGHTVPTADGCGTRTLSSALSPPVAADDKECICARVLPHLRTPFLWSSLNPLVAIDILREGQKIQPCIKCWRYLSHKAQERVYFAELS
jgi:hypothetical protein